MVDPQAAVMVLDHIPDPDEVEELVMLHLDEFPAESASASIEVVNSPPDWLSVHEKDQMGAYLRDGAACILVIYMRESTDEEMDDN